MPQICKLNEIMSEREREAFFERLREEKALSIRRVGEIVEEMTGERIGRKAATSARRLFRKHLERLRRTQEQAQQILEIAREGFDPLDAVRALVKQQFLEEMMSGKEIDLNTATRNVARLSNADAHLKRALAIYEAFKIKEAEREEKLAEIERKKNNKGGISPESLEEIESLLNMM